MDHFGGLDVSVKETSICIVDETIENDLRGTLRNFGRKVGMVGKVRFEARIQELVENIPDLAVLVGPLLIVRSCCRIRSLEDIPSCVIYITDLDRCFCDLSARDH
jgi:hypothetical protein